MYGVPAITAKSMMSFLFLTCCCTIMAYWMWNKALETISAAKAGIYLNAIPLAGGAMIILGVMWAEKRTHGSPAAAASIE